MKMKSALIFALVGLAAEQGAMRVGARAVAGAARSGFQCFTTADALQNGVQQAQFRCYRKKMAVSKFENNVEAEAVSTASKAQQSSRVNVLGLRLEAEALLVICLVAANIIFFICLAWTTKKKVAKIEILLDEEKAMYYRYLHNYKALVLHEVKELQGLNGEMMATGGPDHFPLLKDLLDGQIYRIPMLAPLIRDKRKRERAAPDAPRAKPAAAQTRIASKIKLNLQKAFAVESASAHDRQYFENVDKVH